MELEAEWKSKRFLELSRFWVQKVFVPIVVVVGVIGNLITVIILTRKRMKCSTNVYLTALAIADLIYLLFVLVLSFEHYAGANSIKYLIYWKLYGVCRWIVDAASYISIWLTVSFTVERYIAVCHPMKGKMFCTEYRAKCVIIGVCIFCILSTVSTSFEFIIITSPAEDFVMCNSTHSTTLFNDTDFVTQLSENSTIINLPLLASNTSIPFSDNNCSDIVLPDTIVSLASSELAKDKLYIKIFYYFTCVVFIFVPLVLLATFNCFLINAVHCSQKQRDRMTNSQERSSASQENRITVTLIAVVILFLVCQSPSAGMLIYQSVHPPVPNSTTDNITRGLGNLFNLMVNLNAACNFLLYCALSDKYRRTFKAVFFRGRWGINRHETLYTSTLSMSRGYPSTYMSAINSRTQYHLANGHGHGLKRNISAYTQRSLEAERFKRMTRTRSMLAKPLQGS